MAYRASSPMIEGVRMRLPVTVWKTTVDTATAHPTIPRAARVGRRKRSVREGLGEPTRRKAATARAARRVRSARRTAGRAVIGCS